MQRVNIRYILIVIVVLAAMVVLHFSRETKESLWPKGRVNVDSGQRLVMGTFARIVAVAMDREKADKCIEAGFEQLEMVDNSMSDYKPESELGRINREAFEKEVEVSDAVFEVLKKSISYSKKSGGAFDVTVGPLVDLFREAKETGIKPTQEQISEVKKKVGFEKLKLDKEKRTIRFLVDGMRIDLGGIAKGYAIDNAINAMQKGGAIGGMVDVGGDIRCFGAPPNGRETWLIGLQDPSIESEDLSLDKYLLVLKLNDRAIATSGDYRRFVMVGAEKYSHIIRPAAGESAKELSSVTVISESGIDADAMATAVSVLGAEKGLKLIEKEPKAEAILITAGPEYRIIKTSGAEKYIN